MTDSRQRRVGSRQSAVGSRVNAGCRKTRPTRLRIPRLPTPDSRLPTLRCLLSAVCCLLLTGCKDAIENFATDDAYLRVPGEAGKTLKAGTLMPLKQGTRWKMQLQQGDKVGEEEEVVSSSRPVGAFTESVVETRLGNRALRQEIFRWNQEQTQMVAAGFADKVALEPPLTLFRTPATLGDTQTWNGLLRFKGVTAPGSGASRFSGTDTIKTPAGTFDAYRLDTVIRTTVNGRDAAFRITRWLAPGVGVVQQRTMAGATVVEKKLLSYKIP